MLRALGLAALLAALSACTTTFEGERPSTLYGQHLDAAVALYGPWSDTLRIGGRQYYLWRRRVETPEGDVFCELRLEITSRRLIARRFLQGYPDACALFTAKFVPVERQ